MVKTLFMVLAMITGMVSCILVLMQGGRNTGLNGAFGRNTSLSLFSVTKSRGSDIIVDNLTIAIITIFLGSVTVLQLT